MDIFLFIIWSSAKKQKEQIIEDIRKSFIVLKVIEVAWSVEQFPNNLSRFYGQKLPKNSFKERICGLDPFWLVIVEDKNPVYELRKTTRGIDELVNINMFDKKSIYRKWTAEAGEKVHSKIHGTNSLEETRHDLALLLGLSIEDFLKNEDSIPDHWNHDIVGTNGWESLNQLFYILNNTCRYVVLRNFEGLPESFHVGSHEDIDILTDNYNEILHIAKATPVFKQNYRVQCLTKVDGKNVQFDFRYVGDGYYDKKWEKEILDNRIISNDVYIPDSDNYKYMILYHALIHKKFIASDYIERLNSMFGENNWNLDTLTAFMNRNNYSYCEPVDLSVGFQHKKVDAVISSKRKTMLFIRTTKKKIKTFIFRK